MLQPASPALSAGKPPLSPPKMPTAAPNNNHNNNNNTMPSSSSSSSTSSSSTASHPPLHHPIATKLNIVGYPSLPHITPSSSTSTSITTPRVIHHDRSLSASSMFLSQTQQTTTTTRPIFSIHKRQHSNHMHLISTPSLQQQHETNMILKHATQLTQLSLQGSLSGTYTKPILNKLAAPIPTTTPTTTNITITTKTTTPPPPASDNGPNLARLAFQRKWDDVRDMINKGWDCNERYGAMGGWTAAHEACLHNKHDILQLLYNHGGDMTTQNQSGNTPLHVTCMSDSAECTKLLLDWGVPIHIKNKWNATPFDFAKNKIIRTMLEKNLTQDEKNLLISIRDENIRIASNTVKRKKPSEEMGMVQDEMNDEMKQETNTGTDSQMIESTSTSTSSSPSPSPDIPTSISPSPLSSFKKPTHTRNVSSLEFQTLTLDTTPKRIRHSITSNDEHHIQSLHLRTSSSTTSIDTPFSTNFLTSTTSTSTTSPTPSSITNPALCTICHSKQKAIMYHPCCHVVCCHSCDSFQTRCPMCNQSITARKTITL